MLKVVLDTNVIVSGLNFIGGKPAEILNREFFLGLRRSRRPKKYFFVLFVSLW